MSRWCSNQLSYAPVVTESCRIPEKALVLKRGGRRSGGRCAVRAACSVCPYSGARHPARNLLSTSCFALNRLSIAPAAAWAKHHPLCNATTSRARVPILGRRNMATRAVTLQISLFGNRLAADGQHVAEQQPLPRKGLEIHATIGNAATGDLSPLLPGIVVHRITASDIFTLRHIEPSAATVNDFRPAGETTEAGATANSSRLAEGSARCGQPAYGLATIGAEPAAIPSTAPPRTPGRRWQWLASHPRCRRWKSRRRP